MTNFFEGKKTYIGLIITLLGIVGLSDIISLEELTQGVELGISLVGIVIAVYGRIVARTR